MIYVEKGLAEHQTTMGKLTITILLRSLSYPSYPSLATLAVFGQDPKHFTESFRYLKWRY